MKKHKLFSGFDVNVSDEWHATHIAAFPGIEKLTPGQVVQTARDLMLTSEKRELTTHEHALLRACDAIHNLHRTQDELGGRDPHKLFPEGEIALDKLKFTTWTPDTCGCKLRYVWHKDHPEDSRIHVPHRSVKTCQHHAHLNGHHDPAHHDTVQAENRHKNHSRAALAKELGVDDMAIWHSYTDDRTLRLHHDSLPEPRHYPQKG